MVFRVSVRNDSSGAAPYIIRVELEGVSTSSATPISTIAADEVAHIPVSVDVDLRSIPAGGDRLPFSVVLLDARRQLRNRISGRLPVIRVVPSLPLDRVVLRPMVFARDLAVERVVHLLSPALPAWPNSEFEVVVKNRGRERWAYGADIVAMIAMGTPETHLEWSDRFFPVTRSLAGGLAPGDSVLVRLVLQELSEPLGRGSMRARPTLPTELWITVRVDVRSSYDLNPSNDALYYVLRLNGTYRVAESRTLPAPSRRVMPP